MPRLVPHFVSTHVSSIAIIGSCVVVMAALPLIGGCGDEWADSDTTAYVVMSRGRIFQDNVVLHGLHFSLEIVDGCGFRDRWGGECAVQSVVGKTTLVRTDPPGAFVPFTATGRYVTPPHRIALTAQRLGDATVTLQSKFDDGTTRQATATLSVQPSKMRIEPYDSCEASDRRGPGFLKHVLHTLYVSYEALDGSTHMWASEVPFAEDSAVGVWRQFRERDRFYLVHLENEAQRDYALLETVHPALGGVRPIQFYEEDEINAMHVTLSNGDSMLFEGKHVEIRAELLIDGLTLCGLKPTRTVELLTPDVCGTSSATVGGYSSTTTLFARSVGLCSVRIAGAGFSRRLDVLILPAQDE